MFKSSQEKFGKKLSLDEMSPFQVRLQNLHTFPFNLSLPEAIKMHLNLTKLKKEPFVKYLAI